MITLSEISQYLTLGKITKIYPLDPLLFPKINDPPFLKTGFRICILSE
jgi:hypothetical protein